jgi:hypothetical protein
MTYDALPQSGVLAPRALSLGGWFRILVTDRRILVSWLIFLAFSVTYGYLVLSGFQGEGSAPPAETVLFGSSVFGYLGWSMYWGVPGCLRLLRRLWSKVFMLFGFSAIGLGALGVFLLLALLALVYYPPLGGGVFHFIRRWWASGQRARYGDAPAPVSAPSLAPAPPVLQYAGIPSPPAAPRGTVSIINTAPLQATAPEPVPDVEQRLRALTQLHERGLISRDEHDRQRMAILNKI